MNKNKSEEKNQLTSNKDLGAVTNAEMVSMYDMASMTSGPSDATLEEKLHLNARSSASKGTNKK